MRLKLKFSQIRDGLLLAGGLLLLGHETLVASEPRLILITISAGMIGLPATMVADRKLVSTSSKAEAKDEVEST